MDAMVLRHLHNLYGLLWAAAEFLRQVRVGVGVSETKAYQYLGLVMVGNEFFQLIDVVDNKHLAAILQRVTDIAVTFNGMGVDSHVSRYACVRDQIDLAIGGQVEAGTFLQQGSHHGRVGQGL